MRWNSNLRMLSRQTSALAALYSVTLLFLLSSGVGAQIGVHGWPGYGGDSRHTGISSVASLPMERIIWHAPIDFTLANNTNEVLIHYGSPLITRRDTVVVTVRTDNNNNFRVEGHGGYDGSRIWTQTTDYKLATPFGWTPPCAPILAPDDSLYIPAAGGTVLHLTGIDTNHPTATRLAFYGINNFNASPAGYDGVRIMTPLTSDANGNIYFGFEVQDNVANPSGLQNGFVRLSPNGTGTWVSAATASGNPAMNRTLFNCAPALSADGATLYVGVHNGYWSDGYLAALDSKTLAFKKSIYLTMPGHGAYLGDDGTASPTVGPDGDVYFGVWDGNHSRGWMLHFDSTLSVQKTPGSFGWDDTPSIVPANLVPSYQGASSYLILTKYNDYADGGGSGLNKVAILDPNDTQTDPITGATVMKEVLTILGPTPNPSLPGVREWCINAAAIDPFTKSAIVNCEDGNCYRWNFATNTLSEKNNLSIGIGEAYTSTVIGPDGNSYAINNANLFCMGPNVVDVSWLTPFLVGCQHPAFMPGVVAQEVRIVNTSSYNVAGPISLVLDNLSPYAKLLNAAGTTGVKKPAGSPYITITNGALNAGQSIVVQLMFQDPSYRPVKFTTRVLAGVGSR